MLADGSTPTTGPPKASASAGVNRPVPDPRSNTDNGRRSGRYRPNVVIQAAMLAGANARPEA